MGTVTDIRQEQSGDSKRIVSGRVVDSDGDPIVIDVGFRARKVRAINRTTLTEYEYFDGMRGTNVVETARFGYRTLAAGTKARFTTTADAFAVGDRTVSFPDTAALAGEIVDYIIEG